MTAIQELSGQEYVHMYASDRKAELAAEAGHHHPRLHRPKPRRPEPRLTPRGPPCPRPKPPPAPAPAGPKPAAARTGAGTPP